MNKPIVFIIVVSLCILLTPAIYAENAQQSASAKWKMPKIVALDSVTDKYEPVKFDHEKHVAIESNCSKCHHQHPNPKSLSCSECHSISSAEFGKSVGHSFLACKSCHGTYDISNPGMPDLKVAYHRVCFECHRGMGNVGLDPKGCTETCHARKTEKMSMTKLPAVR
jgi:hypothetical protein